MAAHASSRTLRGLRVSFISITIAIFFQVWTVDGSQACWTHKNLQKTDFFPCNTSADVSACCRPSDICYSNGLCAPSNSSKAGITPFYWLGCTDPTFSSELCMPSCLNILGRDGTTGLAVCSKLGPGHFCCYGFSGCNCSDPAAVFTLPPAAVITTIAADIAQQSTHTSSSSSLYTTSPTPSITSSTTFSTNTSPPTSSAPTSSASPSSPARSSDKVKPIGIGVGVCVFAAAVIVVGLFCLRKRSNLEKAKVQPIPLQEYTYGYKTELGTDLPPTRSPLSELGNGRPDTAELDSDRPPVELPVR